MSFVSSGYINIVFTKCRRNDKNQKIYTSNVCMYVESVVTADNVIEEYTIFMLS